MRERLTKAFATGRWSVDRWIGESYETEDTLRVDVLFVRPAVQGHESVDYPYHGVDDDDAYGDDDLISRAARRMYPTLYPCTFHSAAGCELSFDARPVECRALEPQERDDEGCTPHAGGRRERALEWAPFYELITEITGIR